MSAEFLATGVEASLADNELLDAELAARLGENKSAEEKFQRLLATGNATDRDRARALAGLGEIALQYGDHRRAVELLREAIAEKGLAADQEAAVAERLGRAYALLDEFESAIGIFQMHLDRAEADEDQIRILRFSTLLANVLVDRGNLSRAEELLGRAISIADESRDPLDRARLWWSQSRLHTLRNDPETAMTYARVALDLLEATDHLAHAAAAFQLLAHVENDSGRGKEALELVERGYPLVVESGNRYHEALFKLERARAFLNLGQKEEAASTAMALLPLLNDVSPSSAGRCYALLAGVFKELDERERAAELFELAAERLPAADRYLVEVYTALAELLEAQGREGEALAALKKALRLQRAALSA